MFRKDIVELMERYRSGIGLDISRTSTGVALWYNGILRLCRIVTPYKYSKHDSLWEAKMKSSFRKDLVSLVKDKEFDIVVIENTINGCNAITNKELILLNTVFDDLVVSGVCKVANKKLYRMECSSWRRYLSKLAPDIKHKDKKIQTEKVLESIECRFVLDKIELSRNKKDSFGYYDICDSLGILLGGMLKDKEVSERDEERDKKLCDKNNKS